MFNPKQNFKFNWLFLAATPLVVSGLALNSPATAASVPSSYLNDYRFCAARLLALNISGDAVSTACANALSPKVLATCVYDIQRQTKILATDALATCRQVRQPNELATCVVGISTNSPAEKIPEVLNYCRLSLLPTRFAECVVGLRREINVTPVQAMNTCIDGSDRAIVPVISRP
jgi:AraC-like DNA-binding protein